MQHVLCGDGLRSEYAMSAKATSSGIGLIEVVAYHQHIQMLIRCVLRVYGIVGLVEDGRT